MIVAIVTIIISFYLESIISNYISITASIFYPLFTLISLIIIYPYTLKNNNYTKIVLVTGLLYDIVFTNTLGLNMFIFYIISIIIKYIYKHIYLNLLTIIITTPIIIAVYRVLTYLLLVISGMFKYDINILFKSIYSSIIVNIIYIIMAYTITNYISKKYRIHKAV